MVCTGNVCRSPYLERRLAALLDGLDVTVGSAGTGALAGHPMEPGSRRLLEESGLRADDFVARQLTPALVGAADLVLTATRDHRRQVVQLHPRALRRTHSLVDFADLAARAQFPPEAQGPLVRRLAAGAAAGRAHVAAAAPQDADIADPYRGPAAAFEAMARQIDQVLPPIVAAARRAAA